MNVKRLLIFSGVLGCLLAMSVVAQAESKTDKGATKFCRFQAGDVVAYGKVVGEDVQQIEGDLFGQWKVTDKKYKLSDVKLLIPVERPSKVLALAGNYKDHLGDKPAPEYPEPFYKLPSCLIATGENVIQPATTEPVHFEAELVIVIGKRASKVSEKDAMKYVLGVTCGNDISARVWQKGDVQWWRAKGSDTFGPVGPVIASGLDYDNLAMELRVNGEVKQKTNTANMIHDIAQTVSYISRQVTLEPGDLIFSGTPGKTTGMEPGDVVEVEVQGVGILKNTIATE